MGTLGRMRRARCLGAVGIVGACLIGVGTGAVSTSADAAKRRVPVRAGTETAKPATTKTATPTTATAPTNGAGQLLEAVPLAGVSKTSRAYRVRYRSVSPSGAPIEVTGLAYIPAGKAPVGGWPVLSYAHGTVGLADRCAPSKRLSGIETTVAGTFNAIGMAVVASDFEGLGTPGRHPYLVGISEGRGVLDIVRAARSIPGSDLSSTFVVWGHSQGGHAALFAGELAATWAPELKLAGVVAGAPPSQLTDVAASIENSPYRGYFFMVAAGLNAADPSLDLSLALTPTALALLPVVDTGCNAEVFKAFSADPFDSLVNRRALNENPWRGALLANEPGQVRTSAPILIIHGDQDEQIPVRTSETLKKKLCALGDSVERRVYAGQNHGSAALVSLFEVGLWLRMRVDGVATPNRC